MTPIPLKLISWNVNGIRAILAKGFEEFVKNQDPDILCLQETKAHPSQVDTLLTNYPHHFWHSAKKAGYSGTAIFSKIEPLKITYADKLMEDDEGRIIIAEYEKFILVNVYTPNAQRELTRLEFRQDWDTRFLQLLKNLEKTKPIIVCGDLNVAHTELDLARPKDNTKNAGFTPQERHGFQNLIENGFIDTFREFEKGPGHYTWWSYMMNARAKDIGWRIDYFLISKTLKPHLKSATIHKNTMGSDHCPVEITITP